VLDADLIGNGARPPLGVDGAVTTLVAALRTDGISASCAFGGAIGLLVRFHGDACPEKLGLQQMPAMTPAAG
jgi:hypothetical protein